MVRYSQGFCSCENILCQVGVRKKGKEPVKPDMVRNRAGAVCINKSLNEFVIGRQIKFVGFKQEQTELKGNDKFIEQKVVLLQGTESQLFGDINTFGICVNLGTRITSYNVCYTKLLRA